MKATCILILYLCYYLNTFRLADSRNLIYHDDDDENLSEAHPADVIIHGDPRIHDKISIHVTTDEREHIITVTRETHSVLHTNTEGFVVSGDDDGTTVFDMHTLPDHVHHHAANFFSDDKTGTIVSVVYGNTGQYHVEGILKDNFIIAPPGSGRRHRRSLDLHKHMLYRQDTDSKVGVSDFLEVPQIFRDKERWIGSYTQRSVQPERRANRGFGNSAWSRSQQHRSTARQGRTIRTGRTAGVTPGFRRKRQATKPVVVEVLVIIDKAMFKNFNYSMTELGLFLLHYWHAVDFKFRIMHDPNIRLKVRQYGAFQFGQYQPFIEKSRINRDSKQIALYDTLSSFREWMKKYERNKNFVSHDIAVLQTGEDLCEKTKAGECLKLTSGIGFVSGACISARRFPQHSYDVAVSEIGKSFKGVLVMVHEIGHLLGAHHDGEGSSTACPSTSGHVMSYQRHKAYNFSRFSECSKASIKRFIQSTWYSNCLRETDADGYRFPASLPGQYMRIEDQCKYYVGGTPCPSRVYPPSERCEKLCCEANGYRIKRREPAVDGTDCGGGNVCFSGECLPKTQVLQHLA